MKLCLIIKNGLSNWILDQNKTWILSINKWLSWNFWRHVMSSPSLKSICLSNKVSLCFLLLVRTILLRHRVRSNTTIVFWLALLLLLSLNERRNLSNHISLLSPIRRCQLSWSSWTCLTSSVWYESSSMLIRTHNWHTWVFIHLWPIPL